jgi:hypothetical protein
MSIPPLFLVDAVGSFWAWAITIFIGFWIFAFLLALIAPALKWAGEKLLLSVGFVLFSPIILAERIWRKQKAKSEQKKNFAKSAAGKAFEIKVGKLYAKRGYTVALNGIEKKRKDGGIDIIAVNDDETVLIQCKYWKSMKVDHTVVRSFFGDCLVHICQEGLELDKVRCVLAIPARKSLDYSAEVRFKQNYPKMRYEVVEG